LLKESIYGFMVTSKKEREKKARKSKSNLRTRMILPGEEMPVEEGIEENGGGMFLEKEDVQLIYNAMKHYKPDKEEEVLYSTLLESFEEMLVVDYHGSLPDVEF
jgi:hypothetical protein